MSYLRVGGGAKASIERSSDLKMQSTPSVIGSHTAAQMVGGPDKV